MEGLVNLGRMEKESNPKRKKIIYLYHLNDSLSLIYKKNWKLHWSLIEAQGFKKDSKTIGFSCS